VCLILWHSRCCCVASHIMSIKLSSTSIIFWTSASRNGNYRLRCKWSRALHLTATTSTSMDTTGGPPVNMIQCHQYSANSYGSLLRSRRFEQHLVPFLPMYDCIDHHSILKCPVQYKSMSLTYSFHMCCIDIPIAEETEAFAVPSQPRGVDPVRSLRRGQ